MPILDREAADALELVDAYEPGRSAVFAAPGVTILAVGNQLGSDAPTAQSDLVERVAGLTESSDSGIALVAIPFDSSRPASVVQPDKARIAVGASGVDGT